MRKIIALMLVLAILGCAMFSCSKKPAATNPSGGGVGLTVDKGQGEKAVETGEKAPNVEISGFGRITIPPNTSENITVNFYNPEKNAGYYYLSFELRLNDDSEQGYEVLYKSALVEPGKYIPKINLTHGLPEGEYEGTLYIQPYKMDANFTPTNNLNSKLTIVVKNLG